eukprot:1122183-Prymnesium_polylepis.2
MSRVSILLSTPADQSDGTEDHRRKEQRRQHRCERNVPAHLAHARQPLAVERVWQPDNSNVSECVGATADDVDEEHARWAQHILGGKVGQTKLVGQPPPRRRCSSEASRARRRRRRRQRRRRRRCIINRAYFEPPRRIERLAEILGAAANRVQHERHTHGGKGRIHPSEGGGCRGVEREARALADSFGYGKRQRKVGVHRQVQRNKEEKQSKGEAEVEQHVSCGEFSRAIIEDLVDGRHPARERRVTLQCGFALRGAAASWPGARTRRAAYAELLGCQRCKY